MLSSVVPRATSWCVSVLSAEVMIGIIVPPMPRPMTKRIGMMKPQCEESASIWVSANIPPVMRSSPNGTIRPTGKRSTSAPAIGIVSIAPRPCGAMSQPAESGVSPWTCWRNWGMSSSPPKNDAAKMNIVMRATVRLRLRNSRKSSSGCSGRKL